MYLKINDVDILFEERTIFEDQVFIMTYMDQSHFRKVIRVDLLQVDVQGNDPNYHGDTWIYVIKDEDYGDYLLHHESYAAVVCEIHNRVRPYLEEIFGEFDRYILADHEQNIFGNVVN